MEARWCNQCCSEKAIVNSYPERVFVAIGIQHAMRMRRNVIYGSPASTIFSTLLHKRRDFREEGGGIEHKTWFDILLQGEERETNKMQLI